MELAEPKELEPVEPREREVANHRVDAPGIERGRPRTGRAGEPKLVAEPAEKAADLGAIEESGP